ncbi:LacI family transcriptional regulator [Rhizobium sp. SG_E_25_P2]|jgi:LacI family transcriptional regulator|uniref:LacI family DNA-binding transcriptional regulator n=1 Tax=Rhizobium sp. SG_E_25_P2 TaxID=2879942 RepID=UPI00247669CF|nr:LacI family DNA-binding transcriptional regulator [Rhizobium sp. SG_E_25_P2]MDH6265372.1 LacI family transcriptional regulator [Rhizobium sp. SG_E_25_P2]
MVTIKEIAKAVGVSSATVSRVLNYDPALSISAAKRQAIIETAEALNYATPRNRNRSTALPGAFVNHAAPVSALPRLAIVHFLEPSDELGDPYYIGVRLGIENRCREFKTEIVKVFHSDALPDPALLQSVAGVIVIGKHSKNEIDWLGSHCRHLVFADFDPRSSRIDSVFSDVGLATETALNDLHAMGYKRIAFIGSYEHLDGQTQPFGERRCRAYIDWQKERGGFDPELLALGQNCNFGQNLRLETGYMLAQTILGLSQRPDVILAANDNMAIGAYRAIQEAGLRIPDDIAIVSFNDIPVAQFLNPALSTIKIHGEHIGETAVDLLIERLNGRDYAKTVTIATEMIWRDSCRKPDFSAPA